MNRCEWHQGNIDALLMLPCVHGAARVVGDAISIQRDEVVAALELKSSLVHHCRTVALVAAHYA